MDCYLATRQPLSHLSTMDIISIILLRETYTGLRLSHFVEKAQQLVPVADDHRSPLRRDLRTQHRALTAPRCHAHNEVGVQCDTALYCITISVMLKL
jgi:hypothetical protein